MLSDAQRAALTARLRQGRTLAGPAGEGSAGEGLAADGPAGGARIVPMGTWGVPVFAAHAVSGSVYEYAPLARALDGGAQVHGIEAAGVRTGTTPVDSLAELATRYAAAVRAAQPAGPYRLLGWSMGGVVAFEVARRIEAAGEKVALVALIDAPYLLVRSFADSETGLAALFAADALRAAGQAPEPGAPVGSAALPVPVQLERLAARLVADPADPAERPAMAAELDRRFAVFAAHTTALAGYSPAGAVDAAAVLVSATGSRDSASSWAREFRGGVSAMTTPADHYGCLRPPAVVDIATAIRAALGPAG